MSTAVQYRGDTTAAHATFAGLEREITVDTTKDTLVVHDGERVGGFPMLREDMNNISAAALTSLQAVGALDVRATKADQPYTLALTDRGKSVDTTAAVTVPADETVDFPRGSTVTVTNLGNVAISITPAAGVTLRNAGTTSVGVRTLSAFGVATMRKTAANTWFISGAGLS